MADEDSNDDTGNDDVVLVIKNEGLLHIGTRGALLDHIVENPNGPAPGIDFFDRVGRPQKLVTTNGSITLEPDGDLPDAGAAQLLLDRIDLVLAHWQVLLDTDPPLPTDGSAPPKRVLRASGELPQVVDALHVLFPSLPSPASPTPGDYWHRVAHKLGVAH